MNCRTGKFTKECICWLVVFRVLLCNQTANPFPLVIDQWTAMSDQEFSNECFPGKYATFKDFYSHCHELIQAILPSTAYIWYCLVPFIDTMTFTSLSFRISIKWCKFKAFFIINLFMPIFFPGNFFCLVMMPYVYAILFFLCLSVSVAASYYLFFKLLTNLRKTKLKTKQVPFPVIPESEIQSG